MKPEIAVASSGQKAKLSADLDVKSYVKEPKRRVPVIDTADVVILGGGPAGAVRILRTVRIPFGAGCRKQGAGAKQADVLYDKKVGY